MPSITPNLWFDGTAEEAAEFYVSLFPNSSLDGIHRAAGDNPSVAEGDALVVYFTLDGNAFAGINGGPMFTFSEAVSFSIDCADQAETDYYWNALISDGGTPGQCGWLKDRYGVSWQVIPKQLGEYLGGPDADGARRAMDAMLEMTKLDVEGLRKAYVGE
jgi:predicted 3-demethylubiquinone-9 3-methyltransferase (glyoxalase superfamily)